MSEVIDIYQDSLRTAYSDKSFTITKTIGHVSEVITLTPEEAEKLAGVLIEWLYPSRPVC